MKKILHIRLLSVYVKIKLCSYICTYRLGNAIFFQRDIAVRNLWFSFDFGEAKVRLLLVKQSGLPISKGDFHREKSRWLEHEPDGK